METREFAERVLFATSLEEKLGFPAAGASAFTDEEPGGAMKTPGLPGRPVDLRLRKDGVRVAFPGRHQLIDEEQRAILMHFFANHELLATELMALVLLKFPDAPKAFRRGIIRTLHEEQEHTRWYMKRMAECGVNFGDFPVNGFFWDSIAPMESPLDYVTRLSLTFEQANLDFSKHYAEIMRCEGDEKTAGILSQIYKDEIAHVGYGLKWFRRWKDDKDTDWQAFRRQLSFPLSPRRAKADVEFNEEGRLKAGLTPDFIRQLKIFSQSKGRTPDVYFFNPDAEREMAAGVVSSGQHSRRAVVALANDLEVLPVFLARADDVVLVRRLPSIVQCEKWSDFGFEIPEFEVVREPPVLASGSLLRGRKVRSLRPWSWSPVCAMLYAPLAGNLAEPVVVDETMWNARIRELFSKPWSVGLLRSLGDDLAGRDWFDGAAIGEVCDSLASVKAVVRRLREEDADAAVAFKAPFGTAGQMNRRLLAGEVLAAPMCKWIEGVIEKQHVIVVEPWLDRVEDFSVQYEMEPSGKLRHVAFVRLMNDARGQFVGCRAGMKFCRGMDTAVSRLLMNGGRNVFHAELAHALQERLVAAGYCGPVGVDAFVYRTRDGELRLKPVVEINPRFTMGRLARELMRRVAPGRSAEFQLVTAKMAEKAGAEGLEAHARNLEASEPPTCNDEGKMVSGCLVLNDPAAATQVLAVLRVG